MSDLTDKEKEKLLRALESEGPGDPEKEAQAMRDFNQSIERAADKIKSFLRIPDLRIPDLRIADEIKSLSRTLDKFKSPLRIADEIKSLSRTLDKFKSLSGIVDKFKSPSSMPAVLREIGKQPVLEPPSIDYVDDVGPSKEEDLLKQVKEILNQILAGIRELLQQRTPSLSDLIAVPKPQPAFTRAYQSWEYALEKTGQSFERGEAYDWLKENGCPQYEDDELDKKLPPKKTWLTYLRKAFKTRGR